MSDQARMDGKADAYEPYREALRRDGFKINPYRLGRCVGEAGADLPCPYSYRHSVTQYKAGLKQGADEYRRSLRAQPKP